MTAEEIEQACREVEECLTWEFVNGWADMITIYEWLYPIEETEEP